jgi:hypothetical protein
MEKGVRRPVSVWIAQILLVILAVVYLYTFAKLIIALWILGADLINSYWVVVTINAVIILLVLVAFWGMARRRMYGRWLGVGILSSLFLFSTYAQFFRSSGPLQYDEYENATQAAAGFASDVFMGGLVLWLLLTLFFSKKVNVFFQGSYDASSRSSSADLSVD